MKTEWEYISIASKIFKSKRKEVIIGAGEDDCSVVKTCDSFFVFTTDVVHETTDFPPQMKDWEKGFMSLAVNLSDLAAMGAKPTYFLYTIILTQKDFSFKEFCKGIKKLADKYKVDVIGGDTDVGDELTISGFGVGYTNNPLLRKNAKVGEKVCITDLTGKAQLSLEQLMSGLSRDEIAYPEKLYTPEPRVKEGIRLSKSCTGACTDVSDSLAISLNQIAHASGVRIELKSELIDLQHLTEFTTEEKALDLFLYAGGDYELVYTCEDCKGYEIGRVKSGKPEVRIDGRIVEFKGYTH